MSMSDVNEPKFVDLHGLDWEVIRELKELHEEWSGMKLRETSAYGVRLYQNGSSLVMHHDRISTHVISSIVHIAHQYDNDSVPWPIQIEDHDGNPVTSYPCYTSSYWFHIPDLNPNLNPNPNVLPVIPKSITFYKSISSYQWYTS